MTDGERATTLRLKAAIQRHFWNRVYDHLAWLYDGVDWFTTDTTQRLRQPALHALPAPPACVLEVGMGSGRLHVQLAARYETAGMDLAPGMVRRTRTRLNANGLQSTLAVASVYTIPWPDRTFDAVLSTFAFSAFADAHRALNEMIRVTAPGGRVIIVDAGEAADGNRVAHWLAQTWAALGDYMRDEAPLMAARGLSVTRRDYGPFHAVHVTVGILPHP